jgi:hypothetical protein
MFTTGRSVDAPAFSAFDLDFQLTRKPVTEEYWSSAYLHLGFRDRHEQQAHNCTRVKCSQVAEATEHDSLGSDCLQQLLLPRTQSDQILGGHYQVSILQHRTIFVPLHCHSCLCFPMKFPNW